MSENKLIANSVVFIFLLGLFLVCIKIGMASICYLEQCEKTYAEGDSIEAFFHVIVQDKKTTALSAKLLSDIDFTKYTTYILSNDSGVVDGWTYQVDRIKKGVQKISLSRTESTNMSFVYKANPHHVTPLSSKIFNPGYLFSSIIPALIICYLVRLYIFYKFLPQRPSRNGVGLKSS